MKRWMSRDNWKLGLQHPTPWGYYQDIVNREGFRVAQVAVTHDDTQNVNIVLAAPRLWHAVKMMVNALKAYGHTISDLFDHDEAMGDAIIELKKGARLFNSRDYKKKGD